MLFAGTKRFTIVLAGCLFNIVKELKENRESGNLKHKKELDKACFTHEEPYSDSKKLLAKITISDKNLKDRVYEIALNPKYDGYKRVIASMVY